MKSKSKKRIKTKKKGIDRLDNIKKKKFVEFYCQDEVRGNVSVACAAVSISRQTYYDWLEKDETFRNTIKEAKLQLCDDMEQVLIHRAVDKSDTALIYWLKYNHEKYKEQPQVIQQFNFNQKVDDDRNKYR